MIRRTLAAAVVGLLLVAGVAGGRPVVRAQAARTVRAVARCGGPGVGGGSPLVTVDVQNDAGVPVYVAYAHALAPAPDLQGGLTGLRLADPGQEPVVTVADGQSMTVAAPWAGGAPTAGPPIVALVVTSAGVLLPECGNDGGDTITLSGLLPATDNDEARESAKIMAETIGQLESWHAYPPLYALLHPDARALVPFGAVACWYAKQYGPPYTKSTPMVRTTTATNVRLVDWTWSVTGLAYPNAAEVMVQQTTGTIIRSNPPVTSVEHLVRVNGLWRWFFGTSRDDLASLPTGCGLPATT